MSNTVREGIAALLKNRESHSPWLIPRWSVDLETQVLVRPGIEEIDTGVYTGDGEIWSNCRWPWKAGTDPQYKDKELTYDPSKRVFRVGSTWFDWVNRESHAVGFDVDIEDSGHAESTNQLDAAGLERVIARLCELDYLTLIRSTSGKGLHIYCFFDSEDRPKTANHSEHTQVALAVIEKIRQDCGLDLVGEKIVDVKGVVLWLWADTSDENHPGFTLIKEATRDLRAAELPDWQTQIKAKVISNEKGNYQKNDLDDEHIAILTELEDMPWKCRWIPEHNMMHCHTLALKALHEKRKNEGRPLRGSFDTLSTGSSEINAYITPRPNGVFKVARFGNSVTEHASWFTKDDDSWCYFNQAYEPNKLPKIDPTKVFKRKIIVGSDLEANLAELDEAFKDAGLYTKAGRLVEYIDGKLIEVSRDGLTAKMAEVARFYKLEKKGREVEITPPKLLRDTFYGQNQYKNIRPIRQVFNRPILRADGSLIIEPGYHDGYLLDFDGDWPELIHPNVAAAKLADLVCDFEFVDESSKSVFLATLLTLVCRNVIDGPVPGSDAEANRPGVGKGLLHAINAMIAEGTNLEIHSACDETELRKTIAACLLAGDRYICLDNLKGQIGGAVLEAAMTSNTFKSRLLGGNQVSSMPFDLVVLTTQNNGTKTHDASRRFLTMKLETQEAKPHLRTGFKYPNLLQHVRENRREYLMAAMSILSAHLKAGCPSHGLAPMGSFESWDRIVRAAIVNLGLPDPCQCVIDYDVSDSFPDGQFIIDNWPFEPGVPMKAGEIFASSDDLREVAKNSNSFGRKLKEIVGIAFGKYQILGHNLQSKNNKTYSLELATAATSN